MTECLNFSALQDMSLSELVEHKEQLPAGVDISNLTDENVSDFKYWLDFVPEGVTDVEENTRTYHHFLKSFFITKNIHKYFVGAYGGIPIVVGAHEGLHAIGAELTGGNLVGFEWDSSNLIAYTTLNIPNDFSHAFSLWLPNIILPVIGLYTLKKGWENKDAALMGIGVTTAFFSAESFLMDFGDYFNLAELVPISNLPTAGIMALGAAIMTTNYAAAYGISSKMDRVKDGLFGAYNKFISR